MSVFSNRSIDAPQERAKYPAAVLALVGGREPIGVLRETPVAAARAIDGLDKTELHAPEAPGKWSIAQVLQHLADRCRLVYNLDPSTGKLPPNRRSVCKADGG